MRLITLKSYRTEKGFTLHATIDQIPEELNLPVITAVQFALHKIIEENP